MKRNGDILGLNLIRWRKPYLTVKSASVMSIALMLSACVSTSPLPPTNLASVLTPEQAETVDKVPEPGKELQLSPAPSSETQIKQKTAEPAVQTALAKTDNTTTPAQKAAESAAKAKPVAESTEAKLTNEAAKQKIEAEQAKRKTGLFAAFAKSNQASSSRKRPSVNVPTKSKAKTKKPTVKAIARNGGTKLPGVRGKAIFGIESTNENEELDQPIKVAAVTNLAKRGTHGLLLQRKGVKVGCFPRKLVRLLKQVERKFGRTPIVTSGYRSRRYNRLIRGARNSMHIQCKAADIQVKGVSKWRLARYLRTLPGRGGVGTYCHTASVHIDISTKRDWNRRCSRKRRRK